MGEFIEAPYQGGTLPEECIPFVTTLSSGQDYYGALHAKV
jgi:hypothetical protein